MSEYTVGLIGTLKILLVVLMSVFHWLGGRANKWLRRIIGPLILVGGVCGIACLSHKFSPLLLISLPLYILAFSLGYGGSHLMEKLRKRAVCGLAYGLAGLPIAIVGGNWVLFALQMGLCVVFSVVLGVFNPLPAAQEEGLIGLFSVALVPFYV